MITASRTRGRPKGTGIDDEATLIEVEAMIRRDPELRPTTAIKALGFSDPSTIRRLRDKHTARQQHAILCDVSLPALSHRSA